MDVKKIREEMGVSQETFAKMIGVHSRTVQNWEAGSKIPDSKMDKLNELAANASKWQSNVHGDNIAGNNVQVHKNNTDKLLDLLASKEASLAKAQEHIDLLLQLLKEKNNGSKD